MRLRSWTGDRTLVASKALTASWPGFGFAEVVLTSALIVLVSAQTACGQVSPRSESISNKAGLHLLVADRDVPKLRIVLPGHPASDSAIEVLFPEHVTALKS